MHSKGFPQKQDTYPFPCWGWNSECSQPLEAVNYMVLSQNLLSALQNDSFSNSRYFLTHLRTWDSSAKALKNFHYFALHSISRARLNFCLLSQKPFAILPDFTVPAAFPLSASSLEHPPHHVNIAKACPSLLSFLSLIFLESGLLWFRCLKMTAFCQNWTLPSSSVNSAPQKTCLVWMACSVVSS